MSNRVGTLKTRGRKAARKDRPTRDEIQLIEQILSELTVPIGLGDLAKAAMMERPRTAATVEKLVRIGRCRKLYLHGKTGTFYLHANNC